MVGALSWGLSDAPAPVAWPGAAVWIVGAAWLVRSEMRRPAAGLVLGADRCGELDGRPVEDLRVDWRGPFYVIGWREGSRHARWFAFPDVLDGASRRELRLWSPPTRERGATAAVAP